MSGSRTSRGPFPNARPSAVLLALHDGPRGSEVVLTRRVAGDLRRHRGEISFPGGRLEPGRPRKPAALREAHEEVALDPARRRTGRAARPRWPRWCSLSHIVPVVGRLHGTSRAAAGAGGGRAHPARAAGRADQDGGVPRGTLGRGARANAPSTSSSWSTRPSGARRPASWWSCSPSCSASRHEACDEPPVHRAGSLHAAAPARPRTCRGSSTPVRTRSIQRFTMVPVPYRPWPTPSTGSQPRRDAVRALGSPAALRRGADRDRRAARGGQPQAGRTPTGGPSSGYWVERYARREGVASAAPSRRWSATPRRRPAALRGAVAHRRGQRRRREPLAVVVRVSSSPGRTTSCARAMVTLILHQVAGQRLKQLPAGLDVPALRWRARRRRSARTTARRPPTA